MAVRSGAGTGVIVSLVVFIFATIFGIVFTIVFYSQATKAQEAQVNAEQALNVYVKAAQRNADQFKSIEQSAKNSGQSVAQYLNARYEQLMGMVDGNPKATPEAVTQRAASLGADNASILNTLESLRRQLRSKESELQDRNDLLGTRDDEIDELQARIDQMRQNHADEIRSLQSQICGNSLDEWLNQVGWSTICEVLQEEHWYEHGLGGEHSSEALQGALPRKFNNPQKYASSFA